MAYKKPNLGSSSSYLLKHLGRILVCLLALLIFNSSPLLAQLTQSIQGLVTDASGAVIAGAKVTITNEGMGVSQSVQTNETGNYTFPTVLVGNYDVKCEMQGFKTETVKALRVETGAQVRQNFQMPVGEITETVEVSAAAVALNTENPTVGGVIENKRIVDLPLNGRNVTQLAVLVPGVQFGERTGRGDGLQGFPIPGAGFSVSANGQRETLQVVSLDGVDAKDPRIHITNFVPSIEAIEEFKIQTNAYSAEYGFGGGAVTSITMKSGTNEFHGTLFEFLRNEALDAENYFLNFELAPGTARRPKDKFRRNQFGAVVSGPLIKNKTFWSFNWESRRDKIGSVQTAVWPLDAFRRGDFSELLTGTINPATGRLSANPLSSTTRLPEIRFPTILFRKTACTRGHSMSSKSMCPKPNSGRRIHSTSRPETLSINRSIRTRISAGWIITSVIEIVSLAGSRSTDLESLGPISTPTCRYL